MAATTRPGEADKQTIDDYHVDRGVAEATQPASHRALSIFKFLLLLVVAAVSFALFWVVATLLGLV